MQKEESQLLNVQQSASFLGVKVSTIRLWARTKKLKGVKVGTRGDWRFTKDELSKVIQIEEDKFENIKTFLKEHAEDIQQLALKNHLVHLGRDNIRKHYLEKNKLDYIDVVKELAANLDNLKKGTIAFEKLAKRIAKKSVDENLTLEEAVDGTIFLKQAFWQKLDEEGLLHSLTTQDFYSFSHIIATYSDIVAAKIAFAYHDYYESQVENYLRLHQEIEDKNKTTKERFNLAIKAAKIGVYEWDLVTNKIIWTEELEALYGFPPGGFNGDFSTAYKANHPDDTDVTIQAVNNAIKRKKALDIEYRIIWPDKSVHSVSAKGKTFYDKNGKPLRMVGIVTDITDRKHIEENNRYLATLTENIVDAIISTDEEHKIVTWNKGAELVYGWKAREVLGKKSESILQTTFPQYQDGKQAWQEEFAKFGYWKGEVVQKRKNGKTIDILASVAALKNAKDEIIGGVAVNRDITELKRLERQKDDFIGIASHELKTPVTSIKAYAQLLSLRFSKAQDIRSSELVNKMDMQLNKLTGLIDDLLDVTKIEAGKLQFHQEYFDINTLIEEIVEEVQRTSLKHTLVMKLDRDQSLYGDRERLGQVLTNLLTNAIKYSPQESKIFIKTEVNSERVVLSVQDFGVGIPEDKKDRVFERFYRVDGDRETYAGLGLGLYISSEIVKRHNGEIWVETKEKKGSIFSFSLPLKKNGYRKQKSLSN